VARALPGPRGHALFGHADEFAADPRGLLDRLHREHGDVFSFRDGRKRIVVVARPAAVRPILLSAAFEDAQLPPGWAGAFETTVSRLTGAEHLAQRRWLQPYFARTRERDDRQAVAAGLAAGGRRGFDEPSLQRRCFDALAAALFGSEAADHFSLLYHAIEQLQAHLSGRVADTSAASFARHHLEPVMAALIDASRASAATAEATPLALALADRLGPAAATDELAMLLITHLPLAQATAALLRAWQRDPVRRRFATAAVDAHRREDPAADLLAVPALRHAAQEALRLHPPVWTLARRALAPWPLDDLVIPAGAEVLISPWLLQRSPALWRDPLDFVPERFDPLSPRHEAVCAQAWLPFGLGRRKCLGERLALRIIVTLAVEFPAP
jgi:cytochrome P450